MAGRRKYVIGLFELDKDIIGDRFLSTWRAHLQLSTSVSFIHASKKDWYCNTV
jgi:hypothetical protein